MSQRRIAINLSSNFGAQLISKLFPVVAYAYAQKQIGTVAFGHALFAVSLVDWAAGAVEIGSTAYGQIQVGQGSEDPERMRALVGEILTIRILNTIVAAIALFLVVHSFYGEYEHTVIALGFMLLSTIADMTYIQVGTKTLWHLGLLNVASKCLVLLFLVALVHSSADATIFAVLVAAANSLVSFVTGYLGVRKWSPTLPSPAKLKSLYKSLLPFAALILITFLIERFDYLYVEGLTVPLDVGLYGGASRICQSIQALIPALTLAFAAEMLSIRDLQLFARQTESALQVIFFVTVPVAVGAIFASGDILQLLYDSTYLQVSTPFTILCFSLIPQAITTIVGIQALITRGQIWSVNLALGGSVLLGIAAETFLIRRWGMTGAAVGVLLVKCLSAAAITYAAKDFLRLGRLCATLWRSVVAAALMAGALLCLGQHGLILSLAVGGSIYLAASLALNRSLLAGWLARRRLGRPPRL